jgi:hypothetical protein
MHFLPMRLNLLGKCLFLGHKVVEMHPACGDKVLGLSCLKVHHPEVPHFVFLHQRVEGDLFALLLGQFAELRGRSG